MKKFTKITSICYPIKIENIDTDQIVPARFLKNTSREGFGKYLFYDWKLFNRSNARKAEILLTGNNFGCGSSREHAVWAIQDFGFKVVISSSFGDIFYNNSLKNGLLPISLKPADLKKLFNTIDKNPQINLTIDLENQIVKCHYHVFHFPIDTFRKKCLLSGVDEFGYILTMEDKIKKFEKTHRIFISP